MERDNHIKYHVKIMIELKSHYISCKNNNRIEITYTSCKNNDQIDSEFQRACFDTSHNKSLLILL